MNMESINQLMITLPEAVEEIIHKYHHQIKMKDVMGELKSRVIYCDRCEHDKVYIKNINKQTCCYDDCQNTVCSHCYKSYMSYVVGMADCDEDLERRPDCFECLHFQDLQDEWEDEEESMTSSEMAYMEEQAEEEHWQNSYGCNGDISMMY